MMKILAELRRRNVVRIAAAYIVVSWGLVQVLDTILPYFFGYSDAAVRITVIVLAIGFVPAVVLAWIFELTPEGIKLDHEVDHDRPSVRQRHRRFDRAVLVVLTLAVAYFSVDKFLLDPVRDQALEEAAELRGRVQELLDSVGVASIAVMPLRFEGNNADYEILASGIPENTINLLATFDGVDIRAWSTVRQYKNHEMDFAQVAGQLGVTYLVEGTVRVVGDYVEVTAELVDAITGTVLWPYDSEARQLSIDGIFNTQSEIAASIAEELEIQLTPDDLGDPDDVGTDNWDAYLAYMTGREAMADRTSTQIDAAIDNFLEAIELDPEYAWAYSGLHDACLIYVSYGLAFHSKCEQPVKQYLDKALELDESVGEAWIALGYHLASGSWSCDLPDERKIEALNAMRKGLLLSPASAQAYLWYGNFLSNPCTAIDKEQAAANRIEVEKVLLKGITIAPLFVGFHQNLAYRYSRKGDTDAALDVVRRMRKILPDAYQSYLVQAQLEYSMNGRLDRFIKYMLEAYAHDPKAWNYLVRIADAYMALGDTAKAREYLRLAEDRMTETWMPWRPVFSRAVATLIDDGPDLAEAPLLEMVDRDDLWSVMPLWLLFNLALADGETDAANAYLEQLHTVCDSPGNVCWPVRYLGTARIMQEQGDEQAARKLVEDTWARFRQETDPEWRRMGVYGAGIHKARMLSMLGDKDLALAELQAAVDDGWRGYYGIDLSAGTDDRFYWSPNWRIDAKYDVMLDGIRDEPGFREAFETIEADMKDQLASINEMERNGELTLPESLASGSAKTD